MRKMRSAKTQTNLCTTYLPFGVALAAESAGRNRLPAKRRRRSPRLESTVASRFHSTRLASTVQPPRGPATWHWRDQTSVSRPRNCAGA